MASLLYKTRGNTSPKGKPKVYFCCHPEDHALYFETVARQILEKQNCALWYADPSAPQADHLEDLLQMQLFVMPVTSKLLYSHNRALGAEFPFALQHHIPVLPLMQESGLDEAFNEKCGQLQHLDPYSTDATAISFDEKLEKYLSGVLIGDELAEKIRAAFDAYIFLSYRKKDRKHAQELMRLIHKNDFCRDIAIWYDEFLTPGENFNDSIQEALCSSDLFVMAVTPNLVNETNYIMTTEYPMARDAQKPILPVELVPTDRAQLREKYEGLPDPADAHQDALLSAALLEAVKKLAIAENDSSPEHTFFIGLAYLGGVDVETDIPRALELIGSAAEAELPEAMKKLADIYYGGIGVAKDSEQAIAWQEKYTAKLEQVYKQTQLSADRTAWTDAMDTLGEYLTENRRYDQALQVYLKNLALWESFAGEEAPQTLRRLASAYTRAGNVYRLLGQHTEAFRMHAASVQLDEKLAGITNDAYDRLNLAVSYLNLGQYFQEQDTFTQAEEHYRRALEILRAAGKPEELPFRRKIAAIYQKLGDIYRARREYQKALDAFSLALELSEPIAEETKSVADRLNLSIFHQKIGHALKRLGRQEDAVDSYLKAYEIRGDLAGEHYTIDVRRHLMISYSTLAGVYKGWGKPQEAEELYLESVAMGKDLYDETGTVEAGRDLMISCNELGDLYLAQKNKAQAFNLYYKALETCKQVVEKSATYQTQYDLTNCYNKLGDLMASMDKPVEALSQYENALTIRTVLSRHYDTYALKHGLIVSHSNMADMYEQLNDVSNAIRHYQSSIELSEKLYAESATAQDLEALGTDHYRLAALLSGEAKLESLNKSLDIYTSLAQKHPDNQRYQSNLRAIRELIDQENRKLRQGKSSGLFGKLFGRK